MGYEPGFLAQLEESLDDIVERKIKVITNAGALNTQSLALKVQDLCRRRGFHDVIVASVVGDDISPIVTDPSRRAHLQMPHLDHPDWQLNAWNLKPHCGVAYIGAWGIVEALKKNAQIVICGRVTDASPVIGAAAWWYDWDRTNFDALAGALVAGRTLDPLAFRRFSH